MSSSSLSSTHPAFEASDTPILDLISPFPKRHAENVSAKQAFLIISFFVLGVVVVVVLQIISPRFARILDGFSASVDSLLFNSFGTFGPAIVFVMFLGLIFAAVTIHELGHLASGAMVGLGITGVEVGPLAVARLQGKTVVRFREAITFEGLAHVEVRSPGHLRRKLFVVMLSGPAANLASAGIAALLLRSAWFSRGWAPSRPLVQIFVLLSLFMGVFNFVPYLRSNGMFSDGARLLMLLRSRERSTRWLTLLALQRQAKAGVRPRAWNRRWLTAATRVSDRSRDDLGASWLAYYSANDRREPVEAAARLERCLALVEIAGRQMREALALEAAVFHAQFKQDAEKASVWLSRTEPTPGVPPLLRVRARVALQSVRKQKDEAISGWQEGLGLIRALPETPARKSLEESWTEWREELERMWGTN